MDPNKKALIKKPIKIEYHVNYKKSNNANLMFVYILKTILF